jgi:predicted type IV restriction endonuclease
MVKQMTETQTAAPEVLRELVERFETHKEAYHSGQYNEAQLREEFLNPFFQALGWDVYNRKGYAAAYKEVIHEDAIKIGGRTKAPDYCFRAGGGQRSFFVEAKKPTIDVGEAAGPAYQLRRYAWSAKLPVSILTDFEEFAVYDCRIRPLKTDKASAARVIYHEYTDYIRHWDELCSLFSPEAIRRGSLERFVASKKVKKGTAEVDAAFLCEIESWRDILARNIALRNDNLSSRELNFAVQSTIDRVVFLRICEDRGIEPYGALQSLLNAENVYRLLRELFQRADDRYNSGLFYFSLEKDRPEPPDELTLRLQIDDKPLKDIIRNLYFPDSPYEFSVLPVEILGQVYEQFLGKVIELTKGHQARVKEKPEVRKAGGVYYTPAYIVDYIVRNTVGKLLERRGRKTEDRADELNDKEHARKSIAPAQASKLRILDPACGSGSFLLGAYQHLLNWHRDWYVNDGPEKHARGRQPKLYRGPADEWRLTAAEKKRILLNNIYGVDIDSQAVEVTKLSLLLKVLEGESKESINNVNLLFHERALPDLGNNVKCGNSLIGPDFYNECQLSLLDDEERFRVNAFDWRDKNQGFGSIMAAGGFDAVIGNPPYGGAAEEYQTAYYRKNYQCASGSCDTFALFMEKASSLLRSTGLFGMIVQSAFVSAPSMNDLRELIISKFKPIAFASMPYDVFSAYVDTIIFVAERLKKNQTLRDLGGIPVQLTVFPPRFHVESIDDFLSFSKTADAAKWLVGGQNEFLITLSDTEYSVIERLQRAGAKFSDVADIQRGVTPFNTSRDKPRINPARAFDGTVRRYTLQAGKRVFLRYDDSLAEYKPIRYFKGPRILLRELISRQFRLQSTFVDKDFVTNKSMQSILVKDPQYHVFYLLGLLNSRLISWCFLAVHSVGRRDDFPKIVLKQTRDLPLRKIEFSNVKDKSRHDKMVRLVESMLDLHKKLPLARTTHEKNIIERQITAVDKQIDQLVYELYGLTDAEIAIVEHDETEMRD